MSFNSSVERINRDDIAASLRPGSSAWLATHGRFAVSGHPSAPLNPHFWGGGDDHKAGNSIDVPPVRPRHCGISSGRPSANSGSRRRHPASIDAAVVADFTVETPFGTSTASVTRHPVPSKHRAVPGRRLGKYGGLSRPRQLGQNRPPVSFPLAAGDRNSPGAAGKANHGWRLLLARPEFERILPMDS